MNNGLSYIIYHLPNKTNSIQNGFLKSTNQLNKNIY